MAQQTEVQITTTGQPTHYFSWNDVSNELKAGAWAVTLFILFGSVVIWRTFGKSLQEGLNKHIELMETLNETSEKNAHTMLKNARSLERLSEANAKVASIMTTGLGLKDKRALIIRELNQNIEEQKAHKTVIEDVLDT